MKAPYEQGMHLANKITNCAQVHEAIRSESHPCREVVSEQSLQIHALRQRPEPWFGNLHQAKVLFVSSNPSINTEGAEFGEIFPTYNWTPEESASFFVNRITDAHDSPVTFGHATEPNFLTRSHDGEYRNGLKNPKRPQSTWNMIHNRAKEILGREANPRINYALTEVVHCKSRGEAGVKKAAQFCSQQWMPEILESSPAKIIVILGSQARDSFAIPVLKARPDFGSYETYSFLSQDERLRRDIFKTSYAGRERLVIFNWHPNNRGFDKVLSKVYGEKGLEYFQTFLEGIPDVDGTSEVG